jgi:hypothetical protein
MLTGCSTKPSLELISSSAEIRNDRSGVIEIMTGEREGEYVHPISLSYDFTIKNSGSKTLGGAEKFDKLTYTFEDGLEVYIEPNEKLEAISREVMGFNIFDEKERMENHLGLGIRSTPVIEAGKEGIYTFDFDLGATEENPEIRIAPSGEQLDKLVRNSMEANLVICIEDKEIARFNLAESN